MNHHLRLATIAIPLILSACGSSPPKSPPLAPQAAQNGQLELTLKSGVYSCEEKIRIQVERKSQHGSNTRVNLVWNGNSYRLDRDASYSGLPRFEDASGNLVWIDLPWKSLLLDGKSSKPLASECRPA